MIKISAVADFFLVDNVHDMIFFQNINKNSNPIFFKKYLHVYEMGFSLSWSIF